MREKTILLTFLICQICFSQQIKVAIVDFDNTSGIAKYDGLGKAMSSMLISDIEANVSPKRLQLVERSQINKILKEQSFQKTSSVDKASTVKMGKLLGVKYLLVGDIFILNDVLVINSRLVDAETGNIKFTEKKEGKFAQWLFLKTALAKGLATSISMPFTEPVVLDKEINSAVVTTFSNAITEKDKGNIDKSEELLKIVEEFSADFKYIDDIKAQLEELKKRIEKVEKEVIVAVEDPLEVSFNYFDNEDYEKALEYIKLQRTRILKNDEYYKNKMLYLSFYESKILSKQKKYSEALKLEANILNEYPYFTMCRKEYIYNLIASNKSELEVTKQFDFFQKEWINFNSKKVSDNSIYLHDYAGYGNDDYRLAFGFKGMIDEKLEYSYFEILAYAGESYFSINNIELGSKYYDKSLDLIKNYETYKILITKNSILTNYSWFCAYKNAINIGVELYDKYVSTLGSDVMPAINFAHIFALKGENELSNKLYCWAIQNNTTYKNLKDIIKKDRNELNIVGEIDVNCSKKIILTEFDKKVNNLEELINSKSLFFNEKCSIKFLGDGKCSIFNQKTTIFGKATIVEYSDNRINISFEKTFLFPTLLDYYGSRNNYTFEISQNGELLIPFSSDEKIVLKKK